MIPNRMLAIIGMSLCIPTVLFAKPQTGFESLRASSPSNPGLIRVAVEPETIGDAAKSNGGKRKAAKAKARRAAAAKANEAKANEARANAAKLNAEKFQKALSAAANAQGTITPAPYLPGTATANHGSYDELSRLLTDDKEINRGARSQAAVQPGWWQTMVARPLRPEVTARSLTLEQTIVYALQNSNQIRVFGDLPMIRATSMVEADASFDWSVFLDNRWDDTSDPVGNSLTAGTGISRFRDHHWTASGGARKRTRTGGSVELSQQFGAQWNNSQFFLPNQQGTSRLVLNFTQPIMRGNGKVYNQSLFLLAALDKEIADDEFNRQVQSHLLETTRAYWALYLERAVLLQKLNSYSRAKEIVRRLEKRGKVDAAESQIASAQATLKERLSDLTRARAAVRNAEARLRALVNAEELATFNELELMPIDRPSFEIFEVDMQQSFQETMQARPEIAQAIRQIKSGSIRADMSKHELMPVLNLITETYVAGLEDDNDFATAWRKQFDRGEPGYSIGLQFEVPLQNRAARSRHERRQLELRQLKNKYLTTLETVRLEVEVAVREVKTSQQELLSKEAAMAARGRQLDYLTRRWERLPGEEVSASLMLENLLNAQNQLAGSEYEFLQAQMTYNLSMTNLKRATGTLLQRDSISIQMVTENGLPTYVLQKAVPVYENSFAGNVVIEQPSDDGAWSAPGQFSEQVPGQFVVPLAIPQGGPQMQRQPVQPVLPQPIQQGAKLIHPQPGYGVPLNRRLMNGGPVNGQQSNQAIYPPVFERPAVPPTSAALPQSGFHSLNGNN